MALGNKLLLELHVLVDWINESMSKTTGFSMGFSTRRY